MKQIAIDLETHLIKAGMLCPRMVVLSYYDRKINRLYDREEGLYLSKKFLLETETHLVNQHIFFDLSVLAAEDLEFLPLIFDAIDQGRIHCTKIRQQIIDNAEGKLKYRWDPESGEFKKQVYDLANISKRLGGRDRTHLKKGDDVWRLRYNELDGIPIEDWPEEARTYALDDSVEAMWVFDEQEKYCAPDGLPGGGEGEKSQTQAAWALLLMSIHGVRTDDRRVVELEKSYTLDYNRYKKIAQKFGLIRKGLKESKDTKKIRATIQEQLERFKLSIKLTDGGKDKKKKQIATSREQLVRVPCAACRQEFSACVCQCKKCAKMFEDCKCPSPPVDGPHAALWAIAEHNRVGKVLKTYVPALKRGISVPINPNYNTIIETFRTSCSQGMKIDGVPIGENAQNPPRKGGVRECHIARPGKMFVFCDYDTLEMATLAQVCYELFGYSYIREALIAEKDLHINLAAEIDDFSYEKAFALYEAGDKDMGDKRQFSKIGNYGFAGAMGPDTFIIYAKGYNVIVTLEHAKKLHSGFRRTWKEMPEYFNFCSSLLSDGNRADYVVFPKSGLIRGKVKYNAVCNGFFQHRAAMGAKESAYRVAKECYLDLGTALYGCRPWLFAHDEIGMEVPYFDPERASAAASRLQKVMIDTMQKWCPDVPIKATPNMAGRWLKGAKPIYKDGVLVPSKKEGKGWVMDEETMEQKLKEVA